MIKKGKKAYPGQKKSTGESSKMSFSCLFFPLIILVTVQTGHLYFSA